MSHCADGDEGSPVPRGRGRSRRGRRGSGAVRANEKGERVGRRIGVKESKRRRYLGIPVTFLYHGMPMLADPLKAPAL